VRAAGPSSNDLYDRIVGRVERELIQQVLHACDRVQIKAAARLGINRNTLHKKLAEFRLDETSAPAGFPPDNGDGHDLGDPDDPIRDPGSSRAGPDAPPPPFDED
jgi:two-component system, NtrC family, response regulator AtoC